MSRPRRSRVSTASAVPFRPGKRGGAGGSAMDSSGGGGGGPNGVSEDSVLVIDPTQILVSLK
ncbi:hypothetical protein TELCIR_18270 [Teladorsagia circumcincta]|uniref:Uncharacterized protein n=1 Tax=Teladorsagia circumcincta TaxID=45464 RepID=A0A2G9TQR6_TELCI|nr:hypothetical protein TELCIR_18270 [Teladorsagia circumcincta]